MEQITIKTLEGIETSGILDCFNEAFSDYHIPMRLTLSQLENKIMSENVRLEYSVGVFDGEKMVGVILHGYEQVKDKKHLYNAGTGVVPDYRGQHLTEQMYAFAIPRFKESGICSVTLEVLTPNERAIKVYSRTGFRIQRTVNCYKGNIQGNKPFPAGYAIRKLENWDGEELSRYWNAEPTWQNSVQTIRRNREHVDVWGVWQQDLLAGYLVYIPDRKRGQLFAVHPSHRGKGLASALFDRIASEYDPEITLVNLDAGDTVTNTFLQAIGFENYIQQYEMKLDIDR
ncbi:MAG: GNAT family N-acetyltransferase [Tannerellaceae bacterium]|nr:GNAT family N-acetyltransferase [Tannerellaceae bacterium]